MSRQPVPQRTAASFTQDQGNTTPAPPPPNDARETGGNLDAIKEALDFIRDNQTSTSQKTQVTNFPATQPVSMAAIPLPSGAAQDGTDGAAPPSIPGTGIRGWLRSIYDKLAAGLGRTWTLDSGTDSVTTVPSGTQTVSGTVAVSGTVPVSGTFWQSTQPVSASALPLPTGAATDASLTNGSLRGSVSVSNLPATQPVSGTFFQTTQPVSAAALPLPTNSAQETYGNLDTIANSQEAAMLAAMDVGRNTLSTRGSDRTGALFSERGSR